MKMFEQWRYVNKSMGQVLVLEVRSLEISETMYPVNSHTNLIYTTNIAG